MVCGSNRLRIFLYFIEFLEQRAVREAIARDNQIREMFADLDTNGDSAYVQFVIKVFN
jgi:hypothetical protein